MSWVSFKSLIIVLSKEKYFIMKKDPGKKGVMRILGQGEIK